MAKMLFQKLTPTQEVDLSGYEEAFNYIFSEDDIRNIAISGAYSSGKSSVIESYKKKHPEKIFMHISLAHFKALDESSAREESDNPTISNSLEMAIEGKILNQLIQQIPAEKIPQTNFRMKRGVGRIRLVAKSVLFCVFNAMLLYYINFNTWRSLVESLNDSSLKKWLVTSTCIEARVISFLVMLLLLCVAGFKSFRILYGKKILRKINVRGNEIEIFADSNDSYFDKYLNEVLYLFENADVDGIVFEDIDRFDNHTIFERLHEINTLTNVRLKNKKCIMKNKPIRFFYLLRDDIFENKDRTKFFDFILPIIPVLDSSNSYNKIREYLEDAGVYQQFDDHFLRGVSLYIDDLRLVKNILNEFLIYSQKLDVIELNINKLFAIIVYKNIFPKDFADLQLNQGFVHTLFEKKRDLIDEQSVALNEEVSKLEERVLSCEREQLESQEELDIINEHKKNKANPNQQWSSAWKTYQEWYHNDYLKRKPAIEDRKNGNLAKLRMQIEQKREELSEITNLHLENLLNRNNIEDAFRINHVNEIEQTEQFLSVKASPYFALLKHLISRGYIDESYSDYMTFFYPNSLSVKDKVYLRSVTDRDGKPANYELDSPELVTEHLNEYDFSQPETLNYALSEYILTSKKVEYTHSMIFQLRDGKRFDYIAGYMRSGRDVVPMVIAIDNDWPEMFREALITHALSDDLIREFSYITLIYVDSAVQERVNIDGSLRDYVSEDPRYLSIKEVNDDKLKKAFSSLQVSFVKIDSDGINTELFEYVYQKNLYDINKSNISLMLNAKCDVADVPGMLPVFFTFLRDHQEYALCAYLWNQIKQTVSVYLSMFEGTIQDASKTITELLNIGSISLELKEEYVERLATCVENIEEIEGADEKNLVMAYQKVQYSSNNILSFFVGFGLTETLVAFINSDPAILDYTEDSENEVLDQFQDACIRSGAIDAEKYGQIMENIGYPISNFSVKGLDGIKLSILISLDLIEMNLTNLNFIRASYPNSVLTFIQKGIDSYISIVRVNGIDIDETIKILECKDVSDSHKIELLKLTRQPVETQNKDFSDKLLIYIWMHNLKEEDIPWILAQYNSFSDEVKTSVLQIACDKIKSIASYYYGGIDADLLDMIFKSERADFTEKVNLLGKVARRTDKEKLCTLINHLGADKIADNICGGKKRVKITRENDMILQVLLKAGVIFQHSKAADGQYYKSIKYREGVIQE